MPIYEGKCQECGEEVEFISKMVDKDNKRLHSEVESVGCDGLIERHPITGGFPAVKWFYGKNDKKGCFMGPTNNIYKTDTTMRAKTAETRTVTGPSYKGPVHKERK